MKVVSEAALALSLVYADLRFISPLGSEQALVGLTEKIQGSQF